MNLSEWPDAMAQIKRWAVFELSKLGTLDYGSIELEIIKRDSLEGQFIDWSGHPPHVALMRYEAEVYV